MQKAFGKHYADFYTTEYNVKNVPLRVPMLE